MGFFENPKRNLIKENTVFEDKSNFNGILRYLKINIGIRNVIYLTNNISAAGHSHGDNQIVPTWLR